MFLPGQKVVCVDDVFPDAIKRFYWKLPIKGVTYTVRDLIPGIDPRGEPGEMCVYLVELINPCSDKPPYPERGFRAERFRPLETEDEAQFQTDDVPKGMIQCPLNFKKVDRPIMFLNVPLTAHYGQIKTA